MKKPIPLVLLLLLWGCRSDDVVIEGSVPPDSEVVRVWAVGAAELARVENGAFRLEALPAGPVDVRFGDAESEVGRMLIRELPAGSRVRLDDLWIDRQGRAFPTAVELRGADVVVINELRWAGRARVPRSVDERVAVLAASRDSDALLVRSRDERAPDLRVVLTPGTLVRTEDGDPLERLRLAAGDTIHLRAVAEHGVLLAHEVVTDRAVARRR
jgi:hypothetical protein